MKQQQGAALVIVMAFLSGALMLGMSGTQSALINERLAGNYRASVQEHMKAENILSALASESNRSQRELDLNDFVAKDNSEPPSINLSDYALDNVNLDNVDVWVDVDMERQSVTITVETEGLHNGARQSASIVYSFKSGGSAVDTGFVACNGISFSGGTQNGYTVDAFNSRLGAYGVDNNFGEKAFLYSLKEYSNIEFGSGANNSGFAGVKANVYSAGDIRVLNNNPVVGSFYSGGTIDFSGNSFLLTDDVYAEREISFHVGARVDGDVNSNQKIEVLGNWGEVQAFQSDGTTRSGTSFAIGGSAIAPVIYTQIENRIEGEQRLESPNFLFEEELNTELKVVGIDEKCPTYGVNEDYVFFKYNSKPKNVRIVNWDKPARASELGSSMEIDGFNVFNVNRLSIGGNGLLIEEPTVIVADSDVSLTLWDDAAITLSDGASLKIITKGKTTMNGDEPLRVNNNSFLVEVGDNIIPAYSLVSLYDRGAGVAISSGGDTYLEIVAPHTGVTVSSTARLLGRVFADYIEVSGGGSLHYDLGYGSNNTNPDGSAGSGSSNGGDLVWDFSKWR